MYNTELWTTLAKTITEKWLACGKLPRTQLYPMQTYSKVEASFRWLLLDEAKSSKFAEFMYSNDWSTENIEDNYGVFYGPSIDLKEVLPDIWDALPDDVRIEIMSEILGGK